MLSIRRLVYLFFITCVAFAAHVFFYYPHINWFVWTVLLFSWIPFYLEFSARIKITFLYGIILIVNDFVLTGLGNYFYLQSGLMIFITFVSIYFSQVYPKYYLPLLIINFLLLLSYLTPLPLEPNVAQVFLISAGVLMVICAQSIFFPYCFQFEVRGNLQIVLQEFLRLNEEIFSCYLDEAYKDNLYLFERRLHHQKNLCMLALQQFKQTLHHPTFAMRSFNESLNKMYDLLLDQSLLRWRITDFSVFGLCRNELLSIATELENIFNELTAGLQHKKYYINLMGLNEKIIRLEENYQNVLQVAMKEPLVFLLFIESLKELKKQIHFIYDAMKTTHLMAGEIRE